MKKTLSILLVLVVLCSYAFCQSAAEKAQPASTSTSSLVIDPDEHVGSNYVDPVKDWSKYDDLIAAIKSETDPAKRAEMMHEAEDILMSNFCVIPFYYYNDVYMLKSYVSGVYSSPFATKFFQYTKLSNGSDTLRVCLASEPDYLDPALNSTVDGACLAAASFSGLYTYDASGSTVPACAVSYKVSDDGLEYVVTLKRGLKWSDGSALTASDFVYSWKRATSADTAADYAYMFSGFEGYGTDAGISVEALDDVTLKFKLSAPCAYIEDLMAFPTFFPVKQSAVESYSDWKTSPGGWCQEAGFVSNGPFVCTGWNHDVSMTYEKNPYWYDADKVSINKIEFMLSADDNAIYAAYNAGNLDLADSVPTDAIAGLISSGNSEFHIVDELGTYYAAFNCKSKIFDGKTPAQAACMREAFSLLIDRDYICDNIGQTGQVAANSFIPLGMADGNGGLFKANASDGYFDAYGINNDPAGTTAKAIALLEAAGYKFVDGKLSSETPISLTYLTNQTSGHIAVAESIQQDLSSIGIDLSIQIQDWNVFLQERKNGNFDFAREGWIADFNDPINMLEMWTTISGNNDCQFGR